MSRILITGAGGFIGSNLAEYFAYRGHHVICLTRHDLDVTDPLAVDHVMSLRMPDAVFHCAALGGVQASRNHPNITKVNIMGTVNVVDAAKKCGVKVLANAGSFAELSPMSSAYLFTKRAATDYVKLNGYCTLRLATVYGPGESDTRFVTSVLKSALRRDNPIIIEHPYHARDFIYVDDVCRAFDLVLQHKHQNQIHDIATGKNTYLSDAVKDIKLATRCDSPIKYSGSAQTSIADTRPNPDKYLSDNYGWTPRNFTHGIYEYIRRLANT